MAGFLGRERSCASVCSGLRALLDSIPEWVLSLYAFQSVLLFLIWSGLIRLCYKPFWSHILCLNISCIVGVLLWWLCFVFIRATMFARSCSCLGHDKALIPTSFSSFTAKVFIQSNDVSNGFFYVFNRKENRCDMAAWSSTNNRISGLFRCAHEMYGHWSYISCCQ